jgi:hypothetical protein
MEKEDGGKARSRVLMLTAIMKVESGKIGFLFGA